MLGIARDELGPEAEVRRPPTRSPRRPRETPTSAHIRGGSERCRTCRSKLGRKCNSARPGTGTE